MALREGKFIVLDTTEFASWLSSCSISRDIGLVQNHHTWSPSYANFDQNEKYGPEKYFRHLEQMEYAHLQRGFSQIAQNLTTFPDGMVAVCRPLDKIPAGIKGANQGGICIEHLGNFDTGQDQMRQAHRECIVRVNALLCRRFKFAPCPYTVVYHHWYDLNSGERTDGAGVTKSCPGTAFFGGNTVSAATNGFIPLIKSDLGAIASVDMPSRTPLYSAEVIADQLNVRALPSLSSGVLKQLNRGITVRVYEEQGRWRRIDATSSAWVYGDYLSAAAHPSAQVVPLYAATVTADGLRVRPLPATSGEPVDHLNRGDVVQVYETRGDWCRIHPTESHWVHGGYLARGSAAHA